jgi:heme ABC exporter ATP-binding subunit CcmA
MDPIRQIDVQGVTRSFGNTLALRGIDAAFVAGEIATLEGHNGSGKSTLLGIIGTLLLPTHGRVRYGASAEGTSRDVRRQIGWVSHDSHCYPDLSAAQNLRLAASLYSAPDGAWKNAAERFAVQPFIDVPIRHLSRGQRQRVALARAMVHAPSILLLDEPTTGLDSEGVGRLLAAVKEEAARGSIVIFVTHDFALAEKIADKRLRLERGRIKN